jgi:hypothetical protein
MNTNVITNLSIIVGLIIIEFAIVFYSKLKKGKVKPNYRLFFITGTTWVPLGIVFYITTRNIGLLIMGVIFLIIGIINKDKWEETVAVNPQRKMLLIALALTGLLVLITFLLKYFK